ncbi:MAG: hypothetical protein JWM10_1311 [Myxococcaceae bacterium]|nr:hypothetical protein [Myxococcaceae bacterium]
MTPMKTLPADAALARSLVLTPRDPTALDAAAAQVAAGRGEHVLAALLEARSDGDGEADAAIVDAMSTLEAMMPARPAVAGYLMARLHPVAGGRYLHHVADAIDLHMDASASAGLADSLSALAAEGVRPRSRKRYLQWEAAIRGRVGGRR